MLWSALRRRFAGEIVGFVIVHVERVATEWRAYVVTLDVATEYRQRRGGHAADERGGGVRNGYRGGVDAIARVYGKRGSDRLLRADWLRTDQR